MSHPEEFSPAPAPGAPVEQGSEALAGKPGAEPAGKLRACLVCRGELEPGERRVHVGACARKRKTALQKIRRRRRRG